jgi:hypothetical protein
MTRIKYGSPKRQWVGRHAVVALSGLVLIMGSLIVSGTSVGASNTVSSGSPAQTIPNPPAPGATTNAWDSWAAQQRQAMQSTDWSEVLSTSECQVIQAAIDPITSTGLDGIPAGVVTDAVSGVSSCGANSAAGVIPLTSTDCPVQNDYNDGDITGGVACIGTATVGGNVNYMGASYYRTASSSTFGHTQLGVPTSGCNSSGALADQSPEVTLDQYDAGFVVWGPRDGSDTWSSTWWQDNGGGNYTDFGSVCGMY